MKKNLIILGLLLCTTGFAFADETTDTTAQLTNNVMQQTEVQSQLDRNTFKNYERQRKFNQEISQTQKPDKIKYDKSIKNKKYKNLDKFEGKNNGKLFNPPRNAKYEGNRPPQFKGNKKHDFRPAHKPMPKYRAHHHNRHNVKAHNMHRTQFRTR